LADIERRNDIRRGAFLPLLEVEKEFRRLKDIQENSEFQKRFREFSEPLRPRVREKELARVRRKMNDPNWIPTGMLSGGGLPFSNSVEKRLRKLYKRLE